ncbi:MAG: glycosyltransferase [Planctomycetes bacterium]|nr:glycosyltransferase [Planctomycetota bacterium]
MLLVSVIIPTYNYAHFIERCINSVLSQTYKNIEIIVVDDGSSDNTVYILKKYGKKINYYSQKNSGLSNARNTGIKFSKGDVLQFLDSDDILATTAIEDRIKLMDADKMVIICRNQLFEKFTENGPVSVGEYKLPAIKSAKAILYSNIAPVHAFLVHKNVVNQIGLFDESLDACEDYDYWFRVYKSGFEFSFCNKVLVYYQKHSDSMSSDIDNQRLHDYLLKKRIYKYLSEKKDLNNVVNSSYIFLYISGALKTIVKLINSHYNEAFDLSKELHYILKNISFSCDINYANDGCVLYLLDFILKSKKYKSLLMELNPKLGLETQVFSSNVKLFFYRYHVLKYFFLEYKQYHIHMKAIYRIIKYIYSRVYL